MSHKDKATLAHLIVVLIKAGHAAEVGAALVHLEGYALYQEVCDLANDNML